MVGCLRNPARRIACVEVEPPASWFQAFGGHGSRYRLQGSPASPRRWSTRPCRPVLSFFNNLFPFHLYPSVDILISFPSPPSLFLFFFVLCSLADPIRLSHFPQWHGGMAGSLGAESGLGGLAAMLLQQQQQQLMQRRLHQQVRGCFTTGF